MEIVRLKILSFGTKDWKSFVSSKILYLLTYELNPLFEKYLELINLLFILAKIIYDRRISILKFYLNYSRSLKCKNFIDVNTFND